MRTKPTKGNAPAVVAAGASSAQNQPSKERTEPMNSIAASKNDPVSAPNACEPVNFIRFHGLTLLVVQADVTHYVPIKPVSDLLGLDWRNQRAAVQTGDNAVLYGTRRLISPVINAVLGGLKTPLPHPGEPSDDDFDTENSSQNSDRRADLYIRLDRAQMFLARVNTTRVRSNGNVDAANYLLALQIEWAEALHAYQLHGVAVKKGAMEDRKMLGDLMKSRVLAAPREKRAFDRMIADALHEIGYPIEDDGQQNLPLQGGAL